MVDATPWESVIGLEVHAQLITRSKIFSGASSAFGAPPNTQACAIDLGLPGVLPVLNEAVVRMAIRFGLAIHGSIATHSIFARKNYFYPDLPKGYQISQYELPIVRQGQVKIVLEDGTTKAIGITRAHLEEDAGKSLHDRSWHDGQSSASLHGMSGIDLNRAGVPLLEIVSEPDLRTAKEAIAYAKAIHTLVRYLGICDGNMQEGSFRCDANVSVRRRGEHALGTRTELKNLNSFRFLEHAILFEITRQIEVLEGGGRVVQETRLYDPDWDETRPMRSKEEANDYRYFPDPDLLPLSISETLIEAVRRELPELPESRRRRYLKDYDLSEADAFMLTASRETADYFEATLGALGADRSQGQARLAANWIIGELAAALNREGLEITAARVTPDQLAGLLRRIQDGTLSGKLAKTVFEALWAGEGDTDAIIAQRGLKQITDTGELEMIVEAVIAQHPEQAVQYRAGKNKLLGFFVGQVMKVSKGKANPAQINQLLVRKLNESA